MERRMTSREWEVNNMERTKRPNYVSEEKGKKIMCNESRPPKFQFLLPPILNGGCLSSINCRRPTVLRNISSTFALLYKHPVSSRSNEGNDKIAQNKWNKWNTARLPSQNERTTDICKNMDDRICDIQS